MVFGFSRKGKLYIREGNAVYPFSDYIKLKQMETNK